MESIAKIRLRYHVHKQSIKQISRELHLSRNTIRKILREDKTESSYKLREGIGSKLKDYKERLLNWIEEDSKLPKKQRRNAKNLYEQLKTVGYRGAYDSVQRFVKDCLIELGKVKEAYIPLYFSPGEAYQFDWSKEVVELDGIVQTVSIAQFRLCHSKKTFLAAYLRESQEMVFDAHDKAFIFFGGTPIRGIYDNMKTAVEIVSIGKERKFNPRFMQMLSHYLIVAEACNPYSPWEKGQVEKQVGDIRQWVFVPRLKAKSLKELNQHLLTQCFELSKRPHPDNKNRSILEVFEEERSKLRPLGQLFEGYIEKNCRVTSTCQIQFDRNRYSVDCAYVYQTVSVRAYAQKIVISAKGKIIAEHERCFSRDKTILSPWHYLPLLKRKPGAIRNGAPFYEWELPQAIEKVREVLLKDKKGDKAFVSILLAIPSHGIEAVSVACELAISEKVIKAEYILNILSRLQDPKKPEEIETPNWLKLAKEPLANIERYNQLLTGVSHVLH